MRICFVSMTNLFLCPYIKKYLSIIGDDIDADLIYWNRHGLEENTDKFNAFYSFDVSMNENISNKKKIYYFLKYRAYCKKIIGKNKYDKIIFLHNYMAILLESYLKRCYKRKYVIDIRDYSFESNRLFYFLEKRAIKNSGLAVISSEGYKNFLPAHEYVLCHNDPQIDEKADNLYCLKPSTSAQPIQISFIGLVRFFEQNSKLIDIFGNDDRFRLAFYGQNSEVLQQYAREHNVRNVIFKGHFAPEETKKFYEVTDIINNYYGNESLSLIYALSNKLYYAATLHKPILVCKNTYMEEISKKYAFGITLDTTDKSCADKLYNEFRLLDWSKLNDGCSKFMNKVKRDNETFKKSITNFIYNFREH